VAENAAVPHAESLKHCLEEALPVPTDLVVHILDHKIEQGVEQGKMDSALWVPKKYGVYCRV
jgi:hypothetical protein